MSDTTKLPQWACTSRSLRRVPRAPAAAALGRRLLEVVRDALLYDRADVRIRTYRIDSLSGHHPRGRPRSPSRIEVEIAGLGDETIMVPLAWRLRFDPLEIGIEVLGALSQAEQSEDAALVLRRVADEIEQRIVDDERGPGEDDAA